MTDANRSAAEEIDFVVDRKFTEYMSYVAGASLDDIQSCMKRNLGNIRQQNAQNYQKILQCYNMYNYWGKLDPENNVYELIENRGAAMKEHHGDFTWLYGRLCDYRSKKTLFGIVENWLTFSMASLDRIIEKTFCHYFDLDIVKCDANEVFIDLGAYTGDTVMNYLDSYIGYKKIYCYEIVPHIYQKLRQSLERYPNIELREKGVGDKNGMMYITDEEPSDTMHKLADAGTAEVPVVTLDEDITEPVTFIKMDIEGGEQKAILGCKNHIQATHPKLAVSVYHNNEDIWKCARMIDEIDPGYKFYLRYSGGNYYPSECVLLGV
ncbi:FkbM family methyltransferase [Desulfoscipio sp. XC116]|uniref:FkbM family methyltransferase n=1 Tax=Desulfoscipio sp. XC116 TaxID=3144975 RepID=UPI00325ADCAA